MKLWKKNLRYVWLTLCYKRKGEIKYSEKDGVRSYITGDSTFRPRYESPAYWLMFFILLPLALWDGGVVYLHDALDVYRGYTILGNKYDLKPGVPRWKAKLVLLRHFYTSINS